MTGKTLVAVLIGIAALAMSNTVSTAAEELLAGFRQSDQVFESLRTSFVALGDVDGDGDLDAVLANMGMNPSQVWLNDGTGLLVDSGQKLTSWGHGVDLGDLDGDGDLDLFITCASIAYHSRIYFNDGYGRFVDSGQVLPDRAASGNGVTFADIDADGDLDVLVIYYEGPDMIYVNDGRGQFTTSDVPLPEGSTPGDLDGDGDIDLFVKMPEAGYSILLNNGSGVFSEGATISAPAISAGGVALGDIDLDGDLDAIVTNGDGSALIPTEVLLNDGSGRFTNTQQDLGSTAWGYPLLGDLDGDNVVDLLITNFGQPCEIRLNDGTGQFVDGARQFGGANATLSAGLGDLNGDGRLDILTACFADCANTIWFNASEQ